MSLKKIAEKIGVSTATVSRVLNNPNYKCSTSQTREQIWEVAMEMNYAPNEAAIIDALDLRRPIYKQTAAYGHFGRTDVNLPWERLDKVDAIKAEL